MEDLENEIELMNKETPDFIKVLKILEEEYNEYINTQGKNENF